MGATVSVDAAKEVTGTRLAASVSGQGGKCPVQHGKARGEGWEPRSQQKLVPGTWIEECLSDAGKCPVTAAKEKAASAEEPIDPTNMVRTRC